ncbi:hypothetical protein K3495_g7379, partial [Podosphaera aphanis]
ANLNANSIQFGFNTGSFLNKPLGGQNFKIPSGSVDHIPSFPPSNLPYNSKSTNTPEGSTSSTQKNGPASSSEDTQDIASGPYIHPSRRTMVKFDSDKNLLPTPDPPNVLSTAKFSTEELPVEELFARMGEVGEFSLLVANAARTDPTQPCFEESPHNYAYNIWLEQDEESSDGENEIGTLAAALKRTRDTTDTDKAKIRGGLKTAIKPPRKKRSTLALRENTESVPLNNIKTHHPTQGNDPPSSNLRFDKDSRDEDPQKSQCRRYDLRGVEKHPDTIPAASVDETGENITPRRGPARAARPRATVVTDDSEVEILSKLPKIKLKTAAPPSLSPAPTNSFLPKKSILETDPPFQEVGRNQSQPSHTHKSHPGEIKNPLDIEEPSLRKKSTLKVIGDAQALRKLAVINGKKGMIPHAAKEILENIMVSISLLDLAQFSPAFAQDTKNLMSRKNRDRRPSNPKPRQRSRHVKSDTLLASFHILIDDLESAQAYILQVDGPDINGFDVSRVEIGPQPSFNPQIVATQRQDKAFTLHGFISYGKGNNNFSVSRHVNIGLSLDVMLSVIKAQSST